MVTLGSTFKSNHLYVVISDPTRHSGKCVIVNLTTQRPKSDTTCVLQPRDFPSFIHSPTVVNYGDALEADQRLLENIIAKGEVGRHPDMATAVLARIIQGARASPAFPVGLRKYL